MYDQNTIYRLVMINETHKDDQDNYAILQKEMQKTM
jgi:hypothetical protein